MGVVLFFTTEQLVSELQSGFLNMRFSSHSYLCFNFSIYLSKEVKMKCTLICRFWTLACVTVNIPILQDLCHKGSALKSLASYLLWFLECLPLNANGLLTLISSFGCDPSRDFLPSGVDLNACQIRQWFCYSKRWSICEMYSSVFIRNYR